MKERWYKIDLILNWKEKKIAIYVNNEHMKTENAKFFIHEKSSKKKEADDLTANAISIYGLSPGGESKFSNIKMCEKVCKGDDATKLVF